VIFIQLPSTLFVSGDILLFRLCVDEFVAFVDIHQEPPSMAEDKHPLHLWPLPQDLQRVEGVLILMALDRLQDSLVPPQEGSRVLKVILLRRELFLVSQIMVLVLVVFLVNVTHPHVQEEGFVELDSVTSIFVHQLDMWLVVVEFVEFFNELVVVSALGVLFEPHSLLALLEEERVQLESHPELPWQVENARLQVWLPILESHQLLQ